MENILDTKMIFVNSFKELMKEKHVKNIKVVDLTREANFSRQTFYRYFKDIDDLIYFIHIDNTYLVHNLAGKVGFNVSLLENYLDLMKENKSFYRDIVSTSPDNLFVNTFIIKTKENIINRFFLNNIDTICNNPKLLFDLDFYTVGFAYSILDWIKNDCSYDTNFMAISLFDLIPETLKQFKE